MTIWYQNHSDFRTLNVPENCYSLCIKRTVTTQSVQYLTVYSLNSLSTAQMNDT